MKTESLVPKPAAEAQATRGPGRNGKEAPADLFATLLAAAEGEEMDTPALPAASHLVEWPDATTTAHAHKEPAAEDVLAFAAYLTPTEVTVIREPTSVSKGAPTDAISCMAADPFMAATPASLSAVAPDLAADGQNTPTPRGARSPEAEGHRPDAGGQGQWVSTVAKARPSRPSPQVLTELMQSMQATATFQGLSAEPARQAWHAGSTGQLAGGLVEQLGNPESTDLSVLGGATSERSGDQREGGQGQRGEAPRVILESPGLAARPNGEASAVPRSFASLLGDAMGGRMDDAFRELSDQVSLWAAGQTRKASLRLEAGLREALEVDVSLNGDKAQLAFRTDDAQARDVIRAHAYQILNEMLSQAGLGLDSLSVGGRDAGQSGESAHEWRQHADGRRKAPDEVAAEPARGLGSRRGAGLSVYV
jgi:flagellar hook-length control protein FliK